MLVVIVLTLATFVHNLLFIDEESMIGFQFTTQ